MPHAAKAAPEYANSPFGQKKGACPTPPSLGLGKQARFQASKAAKDTQLMVVIALRFCAQACSLWPGTDGRSLP
jgi:hypothetical protein